MKSMRKTAILFAMLAATALTPQVAIGQERALRGVALVVGEGAYENLPALANPPNDARDVGDLLADLGFDVTTVRDADQRRLTRAFERFAEDAAEADVALVYYSGHGLEVAGSNYLVPVDADISTPDSAGQSLVPLGGLLDELARSVPVTIMLLDACRSDPFPAGQEIALPGTDGVVPVESTGLAAVRGPTPVKRGGVESESLGMVIGFAAEPGAAALDGAPGENSPYAAALLKHVAANGTAFADIMTMVTEEVYLKTQARQLPWTNSSLRRVLSFGEAPEAVEGDEALIRAGRRELLMTIATAPESTRRYVETVAASEGVPLDALYGMLKVLGVDTADESQIETQLKSGAERLKDLIAGRTGAAKSDVELVRLSDLADRAESEGAIALALQFRQRASARADELNIAVDENEANLKLDRLQIGATYADHARTAALNFEPETAIELWGKAIAQVELWDETLAAGYRNNLGVALMEAGSLQTGTAQLTQSAEAFAAALEVFDRDSHPLDWARTESNYGNVLQLLGDRERSRDRYVAAADAHRAALEELTRDRVPLDWATAVNNLGIAMARLGEGEEGTETLAEAVEAFRMALEERTLERAPLDWAASTDNLASALASIGARQEGTETLEEAVTVFESVLAVRSRESAPVLWAQTKRNLGIASRRLGERTEGTKWFARSANYYREALEVFTPERTPLDWAQTSAILGFVLIAQAEREPERATLEEARGAFVDALSVFSAADPDTANYLQSRIDQIDEALGG